MQKRMGNVTDCDQADHGLKQSKAGRTGSKNIAQMEKKIALNESLWPSQIGEKNHDEAGRINFSAIE
jgi:hypothetical protein